VGNAGFIVPNGLSGRLARTHPATTRPATPFDEVMTGFPHRLRGRPAKFRCHPRPHHPGKVDRRLVLPVGGPTAASRPSWTWWLRTVRCIRHGTLAIPWRDRRNQKNLDCSSNGTYERLNNHPASLAQASGAAKEGAANQAAPPHQAPCSASSSVMGRVRNFEEAKAADTAKFRPACTAPCLSGAVVSGPAPSKRASRSLEPTGRTPTSTPPSPLQGACFAAIA